MVSSLSALFPDTRSPAPMSAYSNAWNRRRAKRRSKWTYDSGSWSDSSGGYGRSGSQWNYSSQWGETSGQWSRYQRPWEAREDQWRKFAGEYWQWESSGKWVLHRGGSNTSEYWQWDSSGKLVLHRGGSNADHGQAASTTAAKGSDPSSTSTSPPTAAMPTQTAAAKGSRYVSFADSAPTGEAATSAPPFFFEPACEEYIQMVLSRNVKIAFPVMIAERAFNPESEWFGRLPV